MVCLDWSDWSIESRCGRSTHTVSGEVLVSVTLDSARCAGKRIRTDEVSTSDACQSVRQHSSRVRSHCLRYPIFCWALSSLRHPTSKEAAEKANVRVSKQRNSHSSFPDMMRTHRECLPDQNVFLYTHSHINFSLLSFW